MYIIIKHATKQGGKNLQGLGNIRFIDLNCISIWKENYFPPAIKWLRHIWSSLTSSLKLPLTRLMSKNISHIWLWRIVKSEQVHTRAIKVLETISILCGVHLKFNNEWEQRQISIVEFDLFNLNFSVTKWIQNFAQKNKTKFKTQSSKHCFMDN